MPRKENMYVITWFQEQSCSTLLVYLVVPFYLVTLKMRDKRKVNVSTALNCTSTKTTGGQTTSHYVNTFDYPGVVKQGFASKREAEEEKVKKREVTKARRKKTKKMKR